MSKVKVSKDGITIIKSESEKVSIYQLEKTFFISMQKGSNQIIMEFDKLEINLIHNMLTGFIGNSDLFDSDEKEMVGDMSVGDRDTEVDNIIHQLFKNILNKKDT